MDVFVITDTTHGALKSEKREYDWYDRSAAMAVAMAKYQVASQEAETLDKKETLDEEETFNEEETNSEEEKNLEAKASDTESLETDIYETESGKADEYQRTNTLDGMTLCHEDTISTEPAPSSPILALFFLIVLASKFRKLEIREGKRRVPPFTEKTVITPRPEETLDEARTRVNEIIESRLGSRCSRRCIVWIITHNGGEENK